jgi:hypothetical protein
MTTRSTRKLLTFRYSFSLKGVDRLLPAGDYQVITDEAVIEDLSFPVYRRTSTMILAPSSPHEPTSIEMLTVDPDDLKQAHLRDSET